MDKYVIIIVAITILGGATARSYDYFDHEFHRGFEQEDQWHDGGDWDYSEEGHDFAGFDPTELHQHTKDCDHSTEEFNHHQHQKGFGYPPKNFGHLLKEFKHHPKQFDPRPQGFGHHHHTHDENAQKHFGGSNNAGWNRDGWMFPESDASDDRYGVPWLPSTPNRPTTENPTRPVRTTGSPVQNTNPTPTPLAILVCMRECSLTSEYNPVCGSNNITYSNPGRLECARSCGVAVTLQLSSSCAARQPATTAGSNQTTTTSAPNVNNNTVAPTRFTSINANPLTNNQGPVSTVPPNNNPGFTIPNNILASVFPQTTTEDNFDIYIRTM